MELSEDENATLPPFLTLAFSALGYCFRQREGDAAVASQVFRAGCKLWIVTMESDNRQSRLVASVVGVSIMARAIGIF